MPPSYQTVYGINGHRLSVRWLSASTRAHPPRCPDTFDPAAVDAARAALLGWDGQAGVTQPMRSEPHEGIKADANSETEALEREQSSYAARGGQSSGTVTTGPQPGHEQPPQSASGGTASGDPQAGITAGPDDMQDAVSGDTGPAHPGKC